METAVRRAYTGGAKGQARRASMLTEDQIQHIATELAKAVIIARPHALRTEGLFAAVSTREQLVEIIRKLEQEKKGGRTP